LARYMSQSSAQNYLGRIGQIFATDLDFVRASI